MTQIPLDKLESILDRSSELEKSLSSELSSEDYVKFSKEYSEIEPLKNAIVDWKKFQTESEELTDIINDDSSDPEMLDLAKTELEERLSSISEPFTISVIGCVVNGPGEATMSDVGFTGGGNDSGMLYVDGKQLAKRNNDELIDSIVSEVEKKIKQK